MAGIEVYKRVVDYVGLNVKPVPERFFELFKDIQPTLALLQAMGSDGAKVLSVDANGNLQVTLAGAAALSGVNVNQWGGVSVGGAAIPTDTTVPVGGPWVYAPTQLFNNTNYDRARSASAANLAAQSGLGAALTALPGQWSQTHNPAGGAQATTTKAAGGAGVRHVCTGFGFAFSSGAAIVANTIIINLRDGASGAGTILKSWGFDLPAAIISPFAIEVSGVEIVGSAATAMTIEFAGGLANLHESVNLSGHDAS